MNITISNGHRVTTWYDRSLKLWTSFRVNSNGDQISDAVYDKNKLLSIKWAGLQDLYAHLTDHDH